MIGDINKSNMMEQSERTKQKLDENTKLAVEGIEENIITPFHLSDAARERLTFLIYSALSWTADDVLKQTIEDGYKPTH